LGIIPAVVFGPAQTVTHYRTLGQVLLGPALGGGSDQSRAKELIEVTATDTQSFLAVLHNTLHLDRNTRPHVAESWVRWTHWLISAALTGWTLWAAGWRRRDAGPDATLFLGALLLLMALSSPVCHLHYFCFALPLVMGFLALD